MIQKVIYFKKDCRNVTEFYYSIILKALRNAGTSLESITGTKDVNKSTCEKTVYFLITDLLDFMYLYLKGYRNFIYWYQGVQPEERYMFQKKRWKYYVFSFLERLSLKACRYKIGVSKYMFEHFNNKYGLNLKNKDYFIMPCFNSKLNSKSFLKEGKYNRNVFCYAGGMQPWQGVDYIFRLYEKIEKKYGDNVELKIFTKDIDSTKVMLSSFKINNFSVNSVPQEEMDCSLAECKFGFILRANDVINNVATPTKLSTYLANGVIPIYTSSIHSFRDLSEKYKFLCCLNDVDDISTIESYIDMDLKADIVLGEYNKIFEDYYCVDKYIDGLGRYFS